MAAKKRETDIKDEMYSRVKTVYILFILVGLCVICLLYTSPSPRDA